MVFVHRTVAALAAATPRWGILHRLKLKVEGGGLTLEVSNGKPSHNGRRYICPSLSLSRIREEPKLRGKGMEKHTESTKLSATTLPSTREETHDEAVISKLYKESKKEITEGINELFQLTHYIPVLSIPDNLAVQLDLSSTMRKVLNDLKLTLPGIYFPPKPIKTHGRVGVMIMDAFSSTLQLFYLAEQDQRNLHHEQALAHLIQSRSQLQFALGALSSFEIIANLEDKRQITAKGGNTRSAKHFQPIKQKFAQLIAEWQPEGKQGLKADCISHTNEKLWQFIEENGSKIEYSSLDERMKEWLREDKTVRSAYLKKLAEKNLNDQ